MSRQIFGTISGPFVFALVSKNESHICFRNFMKKADFVKVAVFPEKCCYFCASEPQQIGPTWMQKRIQKIKKQVSKPQTSNFCIHVGTAKTKRNKACLAIPCSVRTGAENIGARM